MNLPANIINQCYDVNVYNQIRLQILQEIAELQNQLQQIESVRNTARRNLFDSLRNHE